MIAKVKTETETETEIELEPDSLCEMAAAARRKYPKDDDIDAAVEWMVKQVYAITGKPVHPMLDLLVRKACRLYIHNSRHMDNVASRKAPYLGRTKTPLMNGEAMSRLAERVNGRCFAYRVFGKNVGLMTGLEAREGAKILRTNADGVLRDAVLLERVSSGVGDNQVIKKVVSEKKSDAIFSEVMEGGGIAAGVNSRTRRVGRAARPAATKKKRVA